VYNYGVQTPPDESPRPASPAVTVSQTKSGQGFFVRALWFILLGWWLSGIASALAWLVGLTIIGLPLTFWIFNRIPTVLTLRPRRQTTTVMVSADGSRIDVMHSSHPQPAFWKRALYFIFVGWWLSGLWIVVAWLLSVTILGLPLAIMMYNRLPAITTLHRY
jgi:uncharacterized membrane protein YccF (DUF307 family)